MPTLSGPCVDCGEQVEKFVRPGRLLRCLECAIAKQAESLRASATPGTPEHEKSKQAGEETRRQILQREGPIYDRWAGGMKAYVEQLDSTG